MIQESAIPFDPRVLNVTLIDPKAPLPPVMRRSQAKGPPAPAVKAPPPADPRLEEERQSLKSVLDGLDNLGRDVAEQQKQRLREMQHVAVELAVALASRLVHERVDSGEFAVEEVVWQVVNQVPSEPPLTIHLHPDDLKLLRQRLGNGLEIKGRTEVRFVEDAALARGDCRGETSDLRVMSSVREQLTGMRQELLDGLEAAEVERRGTGAGGGNLRRFPERRHTA